MSTLLVVGWLILSQTGDGLAPPQAKQPLRRMVTSEGAAAAIPRLVKLIEQFPEDPELYVLLGEAHFALKDYGASVRSFEEGMGLRPELRGRAFNLGRAYHKNGQLDEAKSVFRVMQEQPNPTLSSKGYFGEGLVLEEEGEDDAAIQAFRKSLELDPTSHRPRYRLGLRLLQGGDPEAAAAEFSQVLGRRPLHHGAAFNLSLALLRQGKTEKGQAMRERYDRILKGKQRIAGFKDQLRQRPGNPAEGLLFTGIAETYVELGAHAEAIPWFERALRAEPGDRGLLLAAAHSLNLVGRDKDAEGVYRSLLRGPHPDTRALAPLKKILDARGDNEGLAELKRRFSSGPGLFDDDDGDR